MLKKLRDKKTAKKVWIILAILILPAFILWGSGSVMRSKQESSYAGSVFGRKISLLEYKDTLDAVKNQAIMQFGEGFSEMQKYLNLESQAWDRIVLLAEAKKRKISVSDKEVVELLESYPFFKTSKGQFSSKIYSEMIRYVFRTQPRVFEEQTRQNLMLAKLYQEMTKGVSLRDEEIKEEYRKANEEISIYYIAGEFGDFAKDVTALEQDIKDYFARNSLQFKQPLSFNVEYVSFESEDKIKDFLSRLKKVKDFGKAAKDSNLTVKETGWFKQADAIPGIGWSTEILSLISRLKIGEFSPAIHLDKNYYILKLKERREPYIPELETIKDKVKEALIQEKAKAAAKAKIEDCLKELRETYKAEPKSVDFDKTAKTYGLKSSSTGLFKYGSYIEGIGSSDDFWTEALGLKENDLSGVISMPSGFYIIKLKSRNPIDEKKMADEKTDFVQKLLSQKKQEYFSKYLKELKTKALNF